MIEDNVKSEEPTGEKNELPINIFKWEKSNDRKACRLKHGPLRCSKLSNKNGFLIETLYLYW